MWQMAKDYLAANIGEPLAFGLRAAGYLLVAGVLGLLAGANNWRRCIDAVAVLGFAAMSLAAGIDLGLNYYDPEREWSVSAVAKNLGGQIKAYDDEFGRMPLDVQLGVTKRFENMPFRLSLTAVDLTHWNYNAINHLVAGVDLMLGDQFYVSGGYNFRRAKEMKIAEGSGEEADESSHGAGLSFGAGIQMERFKLQVGYAKYHVSSSSIVVNVSLEI